jgi:formamidopyrimidine-DNA glycosylase
VPELPEVETIRRNVESALVGRSVTLVDLQLPKLIRDSPVPSLDLLVTRQVLAARRVAKVLIVDFADDLSLLAHLKLAGQVAIIRPDGTRLVAGHPVPDPTGPYPHKTTHLRLVFDDGTILYLSDVRRFGWLRLMDTADVAEHLAEFRFGPEGIAGNLTGALLAQRFAGRTIAVKPALLDQRLIAGLGNIYVDEALHRAGVHPQHPVDRLSSNDLDRLATAIPWALERGIAQGGARIVHNRAYPIDGFPEVHARAGEACPVCETTIVKIRVGGRGTYLCPTCQPSPDGAALDPSEPAAAVEAEDYRDM